MNPQDPLASLHPLRDPQMIGWWPLAPGWWFLIAVLVLVCAVLTWLSYRRYRKNAYRRQAALQLRQLHANWLLDEDSRAYLVAVNALLKSVALKAYPQRQVAARNGEQWVAFLNRTRGAPDTSAGFCEGFAHAAYRAELPAIDCEEMGHIAMAWIQRHRTSQ